MADFTILVGETKTATAQFTDAKGGVHPIFKATWTVGADCTSANQTDDLADGKSSIQITGATAGTVGVSCVGQADATAGVNDVTVSISGTVNAPEDSVGTITVA